MRRRCVSTLTLPLDVELCLESAVMRGGRCDPCARAPLSIRLFPRRTDTGPARAAQDDGGLGGLVMDALGELDASCPMGDAGGAAGGAASVLLHLVRRVER